MTLANPLPTNILTQINIANRNRPKYSRAKLESAMIRYAAGEGLGRISRETRVPKGMLWSIIEDSEVLSDEYLKMNLPIPCPADRAQAARFRGRSGRPKRPACMSPADIKSWRKSCGFTQEQAAKHLGVSRHTIIRYESGSIGVPRKIVAKVHATERLAPPVPAPRSATVSVRAEDVMARMGVLTPKMRWESKGFEENIPARTLVCDGIPVVSTVGYDGEMFMSQMFAMIEHLAGQHSDRITPLPGASTSDETNQLRRELAAVKQERDLMAAQLAAQRRATDAEIERSRAFDATLKPILREIGEAKAKMAAVRGAHEVLREPLAELFSGVSIVDFGAAADAAIAHLQRASEMASAAHAGQPWKPPVGPIPTDVPISTLIHNAAPNDPMTELTEILRIHGRAPDAWRSDRAAEALADGYEDVMAWAWKTSGDSRAMLAWLDLCGDSRWRRARGATKLARVKFEEDHEHIDYARLAVCMADAVRSVVPVPTSPEELNQIILEREETARAEQAERSAGRRIAEEAERVHCEGFHPDGEPKEGEPPQRRPDAAHRRAQMMRKVANEIELKNAAAVYKRMQK